jgi:CheY-like chemotaxis protein
LFVDDEPAILRSLGRSLKARGVKWNVHFADTGAAAIDLLATETFDVVIADLRIPDLSGIELLDHVRQRSPGTARVILSGQVGTSECLAALRVAHQCLAKPCSVETIRNVVEQIVWSRAQVVDPALATAIAAIRCLPSPLGVWAEACAALRRSASAAEVAAIVDGDVAVTAKLIQINKSFLSREVGIDDREDLVAGAGTMLLDPAVFEAADAPFAAMMRDRALAVGRLAHRIAPPDVATDALLAGLVHDVGKLALVAAGRDMRDGAAAAGAYVLGLWGFARPIVEAIATQEDPETDMARILRAARAAVHESRSRNRIDTAAMQHARVASFVGSVS